MRGMLLCMHLAACGGHLAATKVLVEAAADLETRNSAGCTPLHLAAGDGHWGVIRVLIGAGANPNSRMPGGETPLYLAARHGHLQAVRELFSSKADVLLVKTIQDGETYTPLDMASQNGHLGVVREMVQQVGIDGCGGETDGVDALEAALEGQLLDVMATLLDAGVVDSGKALARASYVGSERAVKFLLQRPSDQSAGGASYVDNKYHPRDYTPLLLSIANCRPCARRIVRLLIEARADTRAAIRLNDVPGDPPWFNDTPLAYTRICLGDKKIEGEAATEEQLHSLEGIRRLLMRVEAVHAVSWLWYNDAPRTRRAPESAYKAQAKRLERSLG